MLTPAEFEEFLRISKLSISIETASTEMELRQMGAKKYRGPAGTKQLAIDISSERQKLIDYIKSEIAYRKDSPEINAFMKEALAIGIEYFDALAPLPENDVQYRARIAAIRARFDTVIARTKAEIELIDK